MVVVVAVVVVSCVPRGVYCWGGLVFRFVAEAGVCSRSLINFL